MEKESARYCYDTHPYPSSSKSSPKNKKSCCCGCFGKKSRNFCTCLITNLGICFLLFGYTLIGSFIFLAIEGGAPVDSQILATTSLATTNKRALNVTDLRTKTDAVRAKTVENIWDITVSLNILYRDNWTRLAAQEITRFQDEILRSITEEAGKIDFGTSTVAAAAAAAAGGIEDDPRRGIVSSENFEWTFAKSFLYSLTVLTTIGYGSIAPKTTLGKAVTMGYAIFGIPLTLLYLSSVGSILSRIARGVFSRALCCCLCSNCGYCCYDEKRMAEKERRMKKKRQQMEMQQQLALQEPFYVRSNSGFSTTSTANNLHSPIKDIDSISGTDNESKASIHGLAILAPITLCLAIMFIYICIGTFVLFKLENWALLDGFYFCFMSLTTIGFGNMLPGGEQLGQYENSTTIWFCSLYIMSGMALTAMCFNVVHDEIVHRLRHEEKRLRKVVTLTSFPDDINSTHTPTIAANDAFGAS